MTQLDERDGLESTEQAVAAASRGAAPYRANPYPVYACLRESAPVCRLSPPHGVETYLITRYDDAKAALTDPRISKDMYEAIDQYHTIFGDSSIALDDNMLFSDPPKHTRLRRIINSAFTPRRIESLRPRIQKISDELLDGCSTREPVDLLEKFAFPLPLIVICELLGIPEDERSDVQKWCAVVARTGFSKQDKERLAVAEGALRDYFAELIARKRKTPSDDLVGALIRTQDEQGAMNDGELLSTLWVLSFAGHKTTAYLIGNAVLNLLTHRDQLRQVLTDPDLLANAIEEIIRYEGSVENATFRHALEDITIRGTTIPKGALVQIAVASANRDPEKFECPDNFDVRRPGVQSAHLGFGSGPHYCLGAPLARMEMQLALTTLFTRFPAIDLAIPAQEAEWLKVPFPAFRGLEKLPVALDPSRRLGN
ncbi:cytochrome P450 family protein [Streptomyces brasiliensis]|uniref:Cytochrome P450 hydroxylase n=1 Tax=Streptomyces brasiliensis TaxID=1954 RepID=A0A917L2G1_9ACTN|nr:cytochrome P450 [Streptomyces brasiliensis]GGJ41742.1 cytochrome P450 hydroxylase [Streptomyces brasiliensis]